MKVTTALIVMLPLACSRNNNNNNDQESSSDDLPPSTGGTCDTECDIELHALCNSQYGAQELFADYSNLRQVVNDVHWDVYLQKCVCSVPGDFETYTVCDNTVILNRECDSLFRRGAAWNETAGACYCDNILSEALLDGNLDEQSVEQPMKIPCYQEPRPNYCNLEDLCQALFPRNEGQEAKWSYKDGGCVCPIDTCDQNLDVSTTVSCERTYSLCSSPKY